MVEREISEVEVGFAAGAGVTEAGQGLLAPSSFISLVPNVRDATHRGGRL